MSLLRALLACFWLTLSLTATVAPPAAAAEMPCHDTGDRKTPPAQQGVMPCCSQPALPATGEAAPPIAMPIRAVRLTPVSDAPLSSLIPRLEPRPPK